MGSWAWEIWGEDKNVLEIKGRDGLWFNIMKVQ